MHGQKSKWNFVEKLNYMKEGAIFFTTRLTNYTCRILQTCNTVFIWSQTWSEYAQQRVSTCNATMLRVKLKKIVARIAGPLYRALTHTSPREWAVYPATYNCIFFIKLQRLVNTIGWSNSDYPNLPLPNFKTCFTVILSGATPAREDVDLKLCFLSMIVPSNFLILFLYLHNDSEQLPR